MNDYAYQIHAKKNRNENDETCVLCYKHATNKILKVNPKNAQTWD